MVRIPVTLADLDSGRIKNSISKLSKHHPDQPVKPKLSAVQQTFAQIMGYGGYEELRSQAKKNGASYCGQSLVIEVVIPSISLRISHYWSISAEKAESAAAALGLVHLDAFRLNPRFVQLPRLRKLRVTPPELLAGFPVLPKPLLDAVRLATVTPIAEMAAILEAMKSSAQMAATLEAMKSSAQMAATLEALKPSAQMVATLEAMKPSAQMAATLEALKPSAHMAATLEAMKSSAQIAATLEALKPSAQMVATLEALKPSAQMAATLEALKPSVQMAAIQDAMNPLAQLAAIKDSINPLAHIAKILTSLKSKPH